MTIEFAWETLVNLGVSEETLRIITAINGYSMNTLEDVLYAVTGYKTFEQLDEEK